MPNKIRAIVYRVGEVGVVEEIEDTLETYNKLVGGYIETFHVTDDIIAIINEEGKLLNLEPNIAIPTTDGGVEVLVGDIVFVRHNHEGDFISLSDEDLQFLRDGGVLEDSVTITISDDKVVMAITGTTDRKEEYGYIDGKVDVESLRLLKDLVDKGYKIVMK